MIKVGIKHVRQHLTDYLNQVEQGQEVIITKRDEPIARLVPIEKKKTRSLASRAELRRLIAAKGLPLSQVVSDLREERF